VRKNLINAMGDLAARRNVSASFGAFAGFRSNGGSAKNWPQGLAEVRDCLTKLREAFRNCEPAATLQFGPADTEACRRVALLKIAFQTARNYIAKTKLEKKVLDFGDLEMYALEILKHKAARDHYAVRWKAILVDEFQDTNPVQEKLLELLTENVRLTIVGDVKQSVYGFRRADTRVFDRFRKRIGNEVILSRTFRSHAGLVDPMNRIFNEVLGTLHQPLDAAREGRPHDGPFVFASVIRGEERQNVNELRAAEARHIAGEIRRILDGGLTIYDKNVGETRPVTPGDIAILSRTRAPLEVYIDALLRAGIPAVNTGGGDLLETREAKDAMAVLQFAADPADDIALVTLLRGPFFALSDLVLYELSKSKERGESWWNLLSRAEGNAGRAYRVLCDLREASRQVSAERLLEIADELTGYTAVIANLEQGERRLADWFGFLALLRRFASLGRADVLGAERYLDQIREAKAEIPRPPLDAGDAVSLMTIHGSKGLEWPIVFIPDLARPKPIDNSDVMLDAELGVAFEVDIETDGKIERMEPAILTLIQQSKKKREAQEAKRILYVAITRARDRVYLTSAGEKGADLDIMRPGIEAAGIVIETIDAAQVQRVVRDMPRETIRRSADPIVQTACIETGLKAISVTGLSAYAVCPKRFKFQFVDGHPGLAQGSTSARITGTLTHTALERQCTTTAELTPLSEGASAELIDDALRLAGNFGTEAAFAEFRIENVRREVPLVLEVGGVTLSGTADLVGEEFVLDFKTDAQMDPAHHRLQLWVYRKALGKSRAVVAYLRHGQTYEFSDDEMSAADIEAHRSAAGIAAGRFSATPGELACGRCAYNLICSDSVAIPKIAEAIA
jgi:ATP-dependent helicase/nuclease subunit A